MSCSGFSDPLLILSNRAAIQQYDIVTKISQPFINKLESAVALDYWHDNKTLVWSDKVVESLIMNIRSDLFISHFDLKLPLSDSR
uniref:Uncharacterized protein n=2 Tax=Meloidogyne TaxID=189290 RepID=A0A915P6Y5_9BILA